MFIDERAYILIDPNNCEKSLQIINEAISNNEWEKRIDIIKKEKLKILNEMQIIPVIESIITKKIEEYSINVLNLEHRTDRWQKFVDQADKIGLKNYNRFDATNGKKLVINKEQSKIFHIKEGFVGKRWPNLPQRFNFC